MAEYYTSQDEKTLNIRVQYYSSLDIEGFSQMMKDPSYCYKFYWLEAIVQLISEGKTETTFDDIINEMIANAWYLVREFHIHLSGMLADGKVRDGLERAIIQLTNMVPYRALAGFFAKSEERADWNSFRRITTYIRKINDTVETLPYILGESSKLKREVYFQPDWITMIQDNTVSILGWIQYEKVKWL